MSGLASGVTKVFSSIGSGVAKLGSAVKGVGAALFTGGAAAGTGSIFSGGLSSIFGGGTLGKMFSGASRIVGGSGSATTLGSAAADTIGGATRGFGEAAGGIGVAGSGALTLANTATGMAPTGVSGATGGSSLLKGFGDFLGSDAGAGLIGGVGEGLMRQGELDAQAEEAQAGRDYSQKQIDDLRNSYELPANVLPGGSPMAPDRTVRPTPAVAYDRQRTRIVYDPKAGQIVEA